jgi:hypothetical protein
MGKKRYDGADLGIGFNTTIGSKEIEINTQISRKDMPTVTGTSADCANEQSYDDQQHSQQGPIVSNSAIQRNRVTALPIKDSHLPSPINSAAVKKSVSAKSFYAHAPAKPKPTGPLCVE